MEEEMIKRIVVASIVTIVAGVSYTGLITFCSIEFGSLPGGILASLAATVIFVFVATIIDQWAGLFCCPSIAALVTWCNYLMISDLSGEGMQQFLNVAWLTHNPPLDIGVYTLTVALISFLIGAISRLAPSQEPEAVK